MVPGDDLGSHFRPQEGPQRLPRGPQEGPKTAQKVPRRSTKGPRDRQECRKGFDALGYARIPFPRDPKTPQKCPEGPQKVPEIAKSADKGLMR